MRAAALPDPSGTGPASAGLLPAVVLGLDSITGLQSARILAARGVPVLGIVADRRHWGARTNSCTEVVESPLDGPPLVSTLLEVGTRLGRPAVLVPCNDPSVATVSASRDLLSCFRFVLPPHDVVRMLMDKAAFAAYGAAAGLPVPRTEVLTHRADAERIATGVRYPCLVKPAAKTSTWLANTSAKAFTVRSPGELLSLYDATVAWAGCLLVQEWVEGPETELYSCNAYFGEGGRPLATFVARKLRQWPPQVGTSASGVECRNDTVRDTTVALFSGLGFQGLAYLEMKRDRRTGRHLIIEPNIGRPTGRSAIAEAGGVELLYTAYCDAAGMPLPQAREQRYTGAAWLDLRRDLQAAVVAHRQGTLSMAEWLRWLRGPKAHAIWSARDPKPFVADLARAALGGARQALGTTGRSVLQLSEPVGAGRGAP